MLTGEFLDPPALATSLLPAASSEFDHTSRVAQHTPPGSPLPRRRRPALQRRLGGFHIPLPTPTKELANQAPIQTANHPPSNHRRPQHPLRPIPRRARCSRNRPRDLRCANLRRHRRIQRPESRRHAHDRPAFASDCCWCSARCELGYWCSCYCQCCGGSGCEGEG